jgi:hypothetical protein
MAKNFEKVELEINNEKRVIIIKETTIFDTKKYIKRISEAGDDFVKEVLGILQEVTGLSDQDIDNLTFSDLDELRKGFISANRIFFRGADWIGLSKKLEAMAREVVNKMSLVDQKVA